MDFTRDVAVSQCAEYCEVCEALREALGRALDARELTALDVPELARAAGVAPAVAVRHSPGGVAGHAHALYLTTADRLLDCYGGAFSEAGDFSGGLEDAVDAVLALFAADRGLARLCCVELVPGDRAHLTLRDEQRQRFARLLAAEHARRASLGEPVPAVQFEMLVGALFRAVAALVEDDRLGEPRDELVAEVLAGVQALEPAA